MDAAEQTRKERQRERELWLLLIGAAMSNSKPVLADISSVDATDAAGEDLAGLLSGILRGDKEQIWSWLERLGAEKADTGIKGIVAALKGRIARRACKKLAGSMNMSSLVEKPEAFIEFAETQLALLKTKL